MEKRLQEQGMKSWAGAKCRWTPPVWARWPWIVCPVSSRSSWKPADDRRAARFGISLFLARRKAEQDLRDHGEFYICSLSHQDPVL